MQTNGHPTTTTTAADVDELLTLVSDLSQQLIRAQAQMNARAERLEGQLATAQRAVAATNGRVGDAEADVAELLVRVDEVEQRPAPAADTGATSAEVRKAVLAERKAELADVQERALAYLRAHRGERFTPNPVADNIGADNNAVAQQLTKAARAGKVVREQVPGRHATYRAR